jgi:uncharacterized protein YheU (UPF0270 family)
MIEVPRQALSAEALSNLIQEFATRAGADYGGRGKAIEEKIADVQRQLERGEAVIAFDIDTATTNIVPTRGTAREIRITDRGEDVGHGRALNTSASVGLARTFGVTTRCRGRSLRR